MPEPKSQPRQWAILVGVNYYFPGDVRKDPETSVTTRYGDLSGCVRDIKEIQQALLDTQRIAANDIKTLTSTKRKDEPGTGSPIEGRAQWPTYENIKKALEDVTADATPGDFVYFHYCGHGSRSRTLYQDLKTNRLDEGIAPLDINCGGRYLRDVELAFLLGKMVQKALVLTVVLDSCHSGGATRSPEGPEARGIPDPDLSMLPSDGADTPVEELRAAWNAEKARDGQSWLLQPSGYVLLAGCLPHEQSYEGWFSDASGAILKNGRLSYWLVEALREGAAAPVSYRMLHRRIHESMLVDRSRLEPDQIQTPVLVGDGERVFFARGSIVQGACVAVRRVNRTDFHSLELAAGEAHGVSVGSEYAVYEWNTRDISADTPAFKNIIVTDVFELTSKATILSGPVSKWPVGCQAVLLRRSVTAQTNIRLPDIRNPGAVADDMLTHIRTMPEWRGRFSNGIVPLSLLPADDKTSKAYSIIVNRDHQYQLCDVDGTPFPNLPATTDRDAILNSAVHLTQFQRIQRLNNDSKGDFMRCRCKFEVFKGSKDLPPLQTPVISPLDG